MYKIAKDPNGKNIIHLEQNGTKISFNENPDNTDYQQYLKWVAQGNEPLPADEGVA